MQSMHQNTAIDTLGVKMCIEKQAASEHRPLLCTHFPTNTKPVRNVAEQAYSKAVPVSATHAYNAACRRICSFVIRS